MIGLGPGHAADAAPPGAQDAPRQVSRRRYTPAATSIEFLPRLSEALGGPRLFIKRDDLTGLACGGNKTRKLEFLVTDALAQGCDTLVTVSAVQSNHCRLTLAAAAREGLRCRLVLEQRVPGSYDAKASGNNFQFGQMGAEAITVVDAGADLGGGVACVAEEVAAAGGKADVIPGPARGGRLPRRRTLSAGTRAARPFRRHARAGAAGGIHAAALCDQVGRRQP